MMLLLLLLCCCCFAAAAAKRDTEEHKASPALWADTHTQHHILQTETCILRTAGLGQPHTLLRPTSHTDSAHYTKACCPTRTLRTHRSAVL